jgi:hypothetical protein
MSAAAAALNAAELGSESDKENSEESKTKILSISNDQMIE